MASAQYYYVEAGARQAAMGGAGLVLPDAWASAHNQAALAKVSGLGVGTYYANIFNESELKELGFSAAYQVEKYGTAGLDFTYSGNPFSNFMSFGFSYAKQLGKRISGGIKIDYFRHSQMNYGNISAFTGELGLLAEPVDHFFIGAHAFNPWRAKFNATNEPMISTFRLGAGYFFSSRVLLTLEGEKSLEKKTILRAGTEYNVIAGLFLRAGICTQPVKYSFGLGYNYKGVSIDVTYISHQVIGYYMKFGLMWHFNPASDKKSSDALQ
ncbi:MAG: hypothetical protein CSB06_02055 [Bacteroidia bacterium]|nr:MAG: hypothetical protein CSB06_02055 [Bacteroidia bacterium]